MIEDRISVDHPNRIPDGIYFGLDDEAYHRAFALSSHGIKRLRQSTLDFWVRSPLNPAGGVVDTDTEAWKIGRAYDARIVEGRAVFDRRFGAAFDRDDYPAALRTNDELIAAIGAAGGPARGMKGKRKEELIATLAEYDPTALIWDTLVRGHQEANIGKELLPRAVMDRIEIAAAMIEQHPQLCKAFTGGMPQVSIFWEDAETGVPCKARLDYLKHKAIVDLKSYENARGMPILDAIARAYGFYEYNIQARFYSEAADQCRELIENGQFWGAVAPRFIDALQDAHDKTFLFVFQQKGPAPVARGWVPPRGSLDVAHMYIAEAKETFAHCWRTFGTDPWVDVADVYTADDAEIPMVNRFRR